MIYVNFVVKEDNQVVKKEGTFEKWGLMPTKNDAGDIVTNETCAIVIDDSTNKVYRVRPEDVTFVDLFAPSLI